MSTTPKSLDVTIMGRSYKVACEDQERAELLEAVAYLDRKMSEIKSAGKVASIERIAAAHPKGTVAVFSHGDVIKAIVAHFIGMPLDMFHRLTIAPASVTVLNIAEFGARLLRLNDTGPFQPPSKDGRKAKGTI